MAGLVLAVVVGQDGALGPLALEVIGAAGGLGGRVEALVVGSGTADAAASLPVDRAHVADDAGLSTYRPEHWLAVVEQAARALEPEAILLAHDDVGRDLGPRLAFRLGTGIVTDCTVVARQGETIVLTKPVYGGSAMADYVIEARPAVATLRPRAFAAREAGRAGEVTGLAAGVTSGEDRLRVLETVRQARGEGPALKDARIVVSGGRGLGSADNWHYVEELAAALGAAVGASRAVTDAGWVPAALQVGLTGTTVSPDLYIAVGISGAVQHVAGCGGARNIVAINRDGEANIFKHARYGVVGDFKQVLPALIDRVRELRGG